MNKLREAVFAGQFYPSSARGLSKQIASFLPEAPKKSNAISCVLPHAGYIYSGRVAAQTLACINLKPRIVLLGPNHTGKGRAFSIMTEGAWQTPLGEVEVDADFARLIAGSSGLLKPDILAHAGEHSLEVQLPLLKYFRSDFKIVPVALLSDELGALKQIGREIAAAIKQSNEQASTLILASSDMTHFEPQGAAEKKDAAAIKAIVELDEDALSAAVKKFAISMCGFAPVAAMLVASKLLGARGARLINYQTSFAASGDATSVVGYAGIITE